MIPESPATNGDAPGGLQLCGPSAQTLHATPSSSNASRKSRKARLIQAHFF